ncbi:MAG: DNA polymerase IV [Microscillaceae bacterium]|jgi:DNA polymerase-4|nr:DNA polymerase IV [Microscillaceae bacterium]
MRKIIHIDMDAFFASVEQRDNPELQGKPIAVGYAGERGVVAAASYEARKFGVFSAMSSKIALRKCPHLIFVRPRFEAYGQVSRQIRDIFYEYTDLVEPLSLDEAYLDVTENKIGMPSATLIAQAIKKKIFEQTQLTASAGISINKFLAKIASDYQKPNGLYAILPEQAEAFVESLPIQKIHGIGKVTAQKMQKLGISTGGDLKKWEKTDLIQKFGKVGLWYYDIARAVDNRAVNPHRIRKSLGTENTFAHDLTSLAEMQAELSKLAHSLLASLQKRKVFGRTLTLKVKFADFSTITRSKTLGYYIDNEMLMKKIYEELLQNFDADHAQVRLLGLQISNLDNEEMGIKSGVQLTLDF